MNALPVPATMQINSALLNDKRNIKLSYELWKMQTTAMPTSRHCSDLHFHFILYIQVYMYAVREGSRIGSNKEDGSP